EQADVAGVVVDRERGAGVDQRGGADLDRAAAGNYLAHSSGGERAAQRQRRVVQAQQAVVAPSAVEAEQAAVGRLQCAVVGKRAGGSKTELFAGSLRGDRPSVGNHTAEKSAVRAGA